MPLQAQLLRYVEEKKTTKTKKLEILQYKIEEKKNTKTKKLEILQYKIVEKKTTKTKKTEILQYKKEKNMRARKCTE